jgi:hypothetical protein
MSIFQVVQWQGEPKASQVEGDRYETKATQGADLVCDVFDGKGKLVATFAHVWMVWRMPDSAQVTGSSVGTPVTWNVGYEVSTDSAV